MSAAKSKTHLDDYIDVAERIQAFYDRHPAGCLRQAREPEIKEVGDRLFIVYTACAYRSPDDRMPGMGTAWEPFPGPTPFTKDSELMNAETAAWGRAIAALGFEVRKGIATRQDVQNRQGGSDSQGNGKAKVSAKKPEPTEKVATAKQRGMLNGKASDAQLSAPQFANALLSAADQATRSFDSDEAAQAFADRQLDRLPARLVDDVLAAIEAAETAKAAV